MYKLVYNIFKYILTGILLIVFFLSSIFLVKGLVLKEEPINMFGYSFFTVGSGSMEPEIFVGDLIVVKKKDNDHYDVGMVVTYKLESMNTPVTHKIINRDGDIITTQGTANNEEDEPFHVEAIVGEVIYVWSEYYKFSNFVKSPIGIICIILGGFVVIETFSLIDKKILKK